MFALNFAQSTNIDAKITFVDGKELSSKIRFRPSIFYENEIYENSITQKYVVLINEKGKKEKHLFNEFKRIEFTDLKGKTRIFERPIEKFGLFELIYDGKKMKWCRDYTENMYDHSQDYYELLYKNPEQYDTFNLLTNYKKRLKELTSDRQDLVSEIEACNFFNNTYECFKKIVEKYNEE